MSGLESGGVFELIKTAKLSELLALCPIENQALINALYLPLMEKSSEQLINNVHIDVELLKIPARILGLVLPQTHTAHPEESYVASPYGQYVDYGRYETALELGKLRWLNVLANRVFDVLGKICHWAKFDQVVLVDNLLFSTNLYPKKPDYNLLALRQFLQKHFPDRAIVYRSICPQVYPEWLAQLKSNGFKVVFSRQVYLLDAPGGAHRRKRALDIDSRLAAKQKHLRWAFLENPDDQQLTRVLDLYNQLYLEKYARLNPQYTLEYLKNLIEGGVIQLKALWHESNIVAFTGYFILDGVMINPLIGYDRSYPQKEGLYRLLTMETMLEAEKRGMLLNMSSGAAHFKRLRGAEAQLEFNLVYDRHLPWWRRLPWTLTRIISVPTIWLVRRYGL
ncbi:GNAT family N-acetyltransferase [Haliscomenobacter sp.]|uniref:GNAT family N-acetyltransferase n=1 Tax=Haliscomenobacter sp. TaxID=2717303 RepID=UPI0035937EBB